ncbi:peroxiredoxin, partial [Phormidium pseudopriestleyi FRX01]|nr:peroxiredoxin [Phormidium pseudopriestleyi FRX01]
MSRRSFFRLFLVATLSFLAWFNFSPAAYSMGGKLPAIAEPAPEFTLPTNTGDGNLSLSDYRGQWV